MSNYRDGQEMHGKSYFPIWATRFGNKKLPWIFLGVIEFVYLTWRWVLFGWFVAFMLFAIIQKFWIVMGATFFFMYIAPFLETLYDVKTVIRITSSFISIAGDMNRIRRGDYNFLWKVISVPLFLIFGALALYTAIAVWLLRVGDDMKQYSVSELDVVGTAFARSGVCLCFARQIFDEIHDRYVETDDMKHAESYALACKWMMYVTPNKTDVYKGEIKRIQKKYPDFPNEIMVRLNEALTM